MKGTSIKLSDGKVWFRTSYNKEDDSPITDALGNKIEYPNEDTAWYEPLSGVYISTLQMLSNVKDDESIELISQAENQYYDQKNFSFLDELRMKFQAMIGYADNTAFGKFMNKIRNIVNLAIYILIAFIIYQLVMVFKDFKLAKA
jgi:hypothetical protein